MNFLRSSIEKLDAKKWAVIFLLVLWASSTFSIALMELSFIAALVFWLAHRLRLIMGIHAPISATPGTATDVNQRPEQGNWMLWGTLAAYFLMVLLSFFFSEFPKQSLRGIFKIAKPILAFIMAADLFHEKQTQQRFDLVFLITFLIVLADASIQYSFGKDILRGFLAQDSSAGLRLVGPFGDFGKMAAYLILIIPVFFMRFWSEFSSTARRKNSVYALALSAAGFILLYLTRCRGPALALAVAFFCVFAYKRWFKAIGIGAVLLLALLFFAPRGMIIHLNAESKEQSIVERFELWKRAFDVIEAKPWVGTGINTYNIAHEKYDKARNWRVRGYYAHNGYLQLAAEIGLPGIFFFLLFLTIFFLQQLRAANAVRGSPEELTQLGILTGLFAFLLYALCDTNLQSPQSLMSFWYLAGILLALSRSSASLSQDIP